MLEILEVVVQRACREVEQKQPEEVAILAAVLQTKNSLVRREMYERELSRAAPALQAAFVALVNETLQFGAWKLLGGNTRAFSC